MSGPNHLCHLERNTMNNKVCPMRKRTNYETYDYGFRPEAHNEAYSKSEEFLSCLGEDCAIYNNGCPLKYLNELSMIANSLSLILRRVDAPLPSGK
jgi:hypothetical protein